MYVKLQCSKCDNINCKIARKFIPEDSLEGCTRKVSEQEANLLYHYLNEVMPFIHTYSNYNNAIDKINEIYNFLYQIYNYPLGKIIDSKGKIIESPKKV